MATCLNGAALAASSTALIQQRPFAEWTVGGSPEKRVCLFRTPTHFAFSTEGPDGRQSTFKTFKSTLYDPNYATILVSMFRRTIGVNLEKEETHASCFYPNYAQAY